MEDQFIACCGYHCHFCWQIEDSTKIMLAVCCIFCTRIQYLRKEDSTNRFVWVTLGLLPWQRSVLRSSVRQDSSGRRRILGICRGRRAIESCVNLFRSTVRWFCCRFCGFLWMLYAFSLSVETQPNKTHNVFLCQPRMNQGIVKCKYCALLRQLKSSRNSLANSAIALTTVRCLVLYISMFGSNCSPMRWKVRVKTCSVRYCSLWPFLRIELTKPLIVSRRHFRKIW